MLIRNKNLDIAKLMKLTIAFIHWKAGLFWIDEPNGETKK